MDAESTYRAARKGGMGTADACYEVMKACGLTQEQAASLSWHVETGKPAPKFTHEDGMLTAAGRAWHRGQESL